MMEMCALDFCRALNERGWFYKLMFMFAVGKYAYREYELMEANLNLKYNTHLDYGLEDAGYHKRTMDEITRGWNESR